MRNWTESASQLPVRVGGGVLEGVEPHARRAASGSRRRWRCPESMVGWYAEGWVGAMGIDGLAREHYWRVRLPE